MTHDPIAEALDQIRAHGLVLEASDFHLDGKIHHCAAEGHRTGLARKKKGWFVAHLVTLKDGTTQVVVGAFGNYYVDGDGSNRFRFKANLTDEDRQALKEKTEQLRKDFEANRAELAGLAFERTRKMWPKLPEVGSSAYLDRKGVRSFGLRFAKGDAIVVPVRRLDATLVGLQFIQADGGKVFLTGTPKAGAFHFIGTVQPDLPLVFAEGYATAATVHMATGWPVVVCFDAGNLHAVMREWREAYADQAFLVAADNDHETKGNPGVRKGRKAALAFGARLAVPQFNVPGGRTDFNDLHAEQGLDVVRAQLEAASYPDDSEAAAPQPPDATPPENRDSPASAPPGLPDAGEGEWNRLLVYQDYKLKAMVNNVRTVMAHHPHLADVFGYDEFQRQVVKLRDPPWRSQAGVVTDFDEIECAAWFGRPDTYGVSISTMMAREAMLVAAQAKRFHPVRDYLERCASGWDGVERLPTFFSDFCGVEGNDVHARFALCFFIGAVARIYQPGVKNDLMLVLEGPQGLKKSTLLNMLCGDDWFLDLGTSPSDKDFYQLIIGRWIVEISEMASFARAETSHIKRAVSTKIDVFRPAYGRNPIKAARECVFVGTVNNSEWQRDETGGRRYMPIWLKEINFDAIRDLRHQLWGEALHRYRKGENFWELPAEAADVQADRYLDDVWSPRILRWLNGKMAADRYPSRRASEQGDSGDSQGAPQHGPKIMVTTASELLTFALDVEVKKQDRAAQTRVGTIMERLGWQRRQKRIGMLRIRQYVRPDATEADDE